MVNNEDYILDNLIDICFADPINAIQFINDYIIIGTMTGTIIFYDIQNKLKKLIEDKNKEEISSISYNKIEDTLYIGIGDLEILKYKIGNESPFETINIYESEQKHKKNCENAFIFLSPESIFKIQLDNFVTFPQEIDDEKENEYELKYFNQMINYNIIINEQPQHQYFSGKLKMSSYSVPFDFDGNNFLYVEFLNNGNRKICIKNIPLISDKKKSFEKELDKNNNDIGHISFAKLLNDKQLFIIHSLNKCEIRLFIDEFKINENFTHIGEEVYAYDIFYENENNNFNYKKDNQDYNNSTIEDKKDGIFENFTFQNSRKILKINSIGKESEGELPLTLNSKDKIAKENKESNNKIINIITLDINGNVNLYKKGKEITLFNMYELNYISQDYKDKQFFSLGYAYHIKTNLNYFCISTDHGCFLIKKNNI